VKDDNKRYKPWALVSGLQSVLLVVAVTAVLSGCAGSADRSGGGDWSDYAEVPDAVPKAEPRSKYGNPDSYVVFGKRYRTKKSSAGHLERGLASWYGKKFHGRKTSNGERYDMYAMTAAHKSLPLPTYAKVTNLENGRTAVVRINDRGPFHGNRVIDLSYAAARKLGVVRKGTALVEVEAIDPRRPKSRPAGEYLFADADSQPTGKSAAKGAASETKASTAARRPAPSRPADAQVARSTPPARTGTEARAASKRPSPAPDRAEVRVARADAPSASEPGMTSARGAGDSGLYLQVGAFGNRTNAEQLRRQLLERLSEGVLVRTSDGGRAPLYKVHVGPFASRQMARDVSQQIASLGLKEFHVVTE
jgi:rare lipoprotein A